MDLLQQQEDSTLCADLSAMMYDLALCRPGLDIVCHPESVRVIVNLSNHTHEPTRACCARLLGLVLARGGIDRVIQAGGEQAVCMIGMLAATLTTEVDAVGRARLGVGNLGPMPQDSGASRYGEGSAQDAVVEARSWSAAEPPAPIHHAATEAVAMPVSGGAVDAQLPMSSPIPAATASNTESYPNAAVVTAALPAEPEPPMTIRPVQPGHQQHPQSYLAPPPQVPPAVVPSSPQVSSFVAGSVSQQPEARMAYPSPQPPQATSTAPPPAQVSPLLPAPPLATSVAPAPADVQPAQNTERHELPAAAATVTPAAPSMQEADANALLQLLEQFKLQDTLAALREYGVGCVDDLRELEPSEVDGLSVTPIGKKKLHKLMVHLGVPAFQPKVLSVSLSERERDGT